MEIKDLLNELQHGEEVNLRKCVETDSYNITVGKIVNGKLLRVTTAISALEWEHLNPRCFPAFYQCMIVDKLKELRERAE